MVLCCRRRPSRPDTLLPHAPDNARREPASGAPADRAHLYRQRTPLVHSPSSTPHALDSPSPSPPTATAQPRPSPPVDGGSLSSRPQQPPRSACLTKQSLSAAGRAVQRDGPQTTLGEEKPRSPAGTSARIRSPDSDVDELGQLRGGGFPGRVRPRLRRHRAHPRAPGLLLLRHRPRRDRRRTQARPRRPRQAAVPKGAGRGVAAGARVPAQRAARRVRQARQGGRGRRAVPAQGGPRGARRVRGAAPRAAWHVRVLPRGRRRREARRRRHRRRVRAHLRGQGRRLDARRRCPVQDVRGLVQEDPPHEEL